MKFESFKNFLYEVIVTMIYRSELTRPVQSPAEHRNIYGVSVRQIGNINSSFLKRRYKDAH